MRLVERAQFSLFTDAPPPPGQGGGSVCTQASSVMTIYVWISGCSHSKNKFDERKQDWLVQKWKQSGIVWTRSGVKGEYLTIIPRARMGSESIAHEALGRMGYWLRGQESERNNCVSKIQLVGHKHREKTTLASKTRFSRHCLIFKAGALRC